MAKIVKHYVEGALVIDWDSVFLFIAFRFEWFAHSSVYTFIGLEPIFRGWLLFDFGLFDIFVHCSFGMGIIFDFPSTSLNSVVSSTQRICNGDDEMTKQTSGRNVYELRHI